VAFQLLVKACHTFQLLRVASLPVTQCHVLLVFLLQHVAQRAVCIRGQHRTHVLRVIVYCPLFACVLSERQVETLKVTLHTQQRGMQPAARQGVGLTCHLSEIIQVVLAAQGQHLVGGQLSVELHKLRTLTLAFKFHHFHDLLLALFQCRE